MLKYTGTAIVMQEVPDEVSLAINISRCPYHCEGCHSPELQMDVGRELREDIDDILDKNQGMVSCILFMGGDQEEEELKEYALKAKEKGFKTALYTGRSNMFKLTDETLQYFDYIKQGPYLKEFGPIDKPGSNQQMYKLTHFENGGVGFVNITHKFYR